MFWNIPSNIFSLLTTCKAQAFSKARSLLQLLCNSIPLTPEQKKNQHSPAFISERYLIKDELLDLLPGYNGTEFKDTQVLPFSKQIQPPYL